MLWDNEFLYVFAKLYEEHIWGNITKRDAVIFKNNDFEVFINPNDHVFSYGEIEINAFPSLENITLFIINPCPSSFLKGVFEISSSSFHRNI